MIRANGILITPTIFPDGTSQVWKLPEALFLERDYVSVEWRFEAERELFDILSLRMLLATPRMDLFIPYLPYARQDKNIGNFETFSLDIFADILNNGGYWDRVSAYDVHNVDRTTALIKNFHNIPITSVQRDLIKKLQPDYLVYPDLGAFTRYHAALNLSIYKRLIFYKHRNPLTGEIEGHDCSYHDSYFGLTVQNTSISGLTQCLKGGETFLILDDLVDGGATFISIAKTLQQAAPAPNIHLFATHGLFSKGRVVLEEAGITLHTTNTLLRNEGQKGTISL